MTSQRTIQDANDPSAIREEIAHDLHFEIVHRGSGETKTVRWVASIKGAILADGFIGHELKFRARKGVGFGIAKDWYITKKELGRLRNAIEGSGVA